MNFSALANSWPDHNTTVSVIYIGVVYVDIKYYAKWWPLALEHCIVKVLAHQCQCGDWLLHVYACGIPLQVPIQHKMITPTLLTQAEVSSEHASLTPNSSVVNVDSHTCRCSWLVYLQIDWLNAYHAECLDKVGGYLADQGKTEALQWLQRETKPVGWSILELWYSPSIQFLIIGTGWTLSFKLWMMLYTQLNASSTLQRVRRDIILWSQIPDCTWYN